MSLLQVMLKRKADAEAMKPIAAPKAKAKTVKRETENAPSEFSRQKELLGKASSEFSPSDIEELLALAKDKLAVIKGDDGKEKLAFRKSDAIVPSASAKDTPASKAPPQVPSDAQSSIDGIASASATDPSAPKAPPQVLSGAKSSIDGVATHLTRDKPYGKGREAGLFLDEKDRRAKWHNYMSTFTAPALARPGRVQRRPEELAAQTSSPEGKLWWFPQWVQAGGSWAHVEYQEILSRLSREVEGTSDEWITLAQAICIFKDEEVATAICQEKLNNPKMNRRHRDVPWLDSARQFLVALISLDFQDFPDFFWIYRIYRISRISQISSRFIGFQGFPRFLLDLSDFKHVNDFLDFF